jgi:hypothetical protein
VAQVVECLPSNLKAMSQTPLNKKKEKYVTTKIFIIVQVTTQHHKSQVKNSLPF